MRGKRWSEVRDKNACRITPADAGKTERYDRPPKHGEDHPRGCGENFFAGGYSLRCEGSPPRMRGKLRRYHKNVKSFGITPADAGKTGRKDRSGVSNEDHPRGCGENCIPASDYYRQYGSPPRMRGKLGRYDKTQGVQRITPADAGKTLKRSFRNQPFCSRAVQISFNFSNSLNVSLQSGSAR